MVMSSADRVAPVLQPALAGLHLLVEDVTVVPAGKRSVLRIAVDRDLDALALDDAAPVPPLTLDEVADATRAVGTALDDSDVMGSRPYVLEVSSPGVDRPLTLPRHFRRNVGRLVSLNLADGSVVTGRIRSVREGTVSLDSGPGAASQQVEVGQLAGARVQVEFSRAATPADGLDPDDVAGADIDADIDGDSWAHGDDADGQEED